MITNFDAEVLRNEEIAEGFYLLEFSMPENLEPLPGQFLNIKCTDTCVPLLRRPFAFSAFDGEKHSASIIYQKRGTGTTYLTQKEPGSQIDIIGPLGNTFNLTPAEKNPVLVAGGIGLGPVIFYHDYLKKQGYSPRFTAGFRSKNLVPQGLPEDCKICTDDGSQGFRGNTVQYIENQNWTDAEIFCCGPDPMLKACHGAGQTFNQPCFVSMEQIMACGVGACMGCVIKTTDEKGYARVCKEGPVFPSTLIDWEQH